MPLEDEETTGTTAEAQPEGTTEQEARPDFLLERFESVEAQARSYADAERKIREQGTELNQLREELDSLVELQQNPNLQQQGGGEEQMLANALARAREDGDYHAELAINARLTELVFDAKQQAAQAQQPAEDLGPVAALAEINARAKYDDYEELQTEAARILTENPNLVPDGTLQGVQKGLETALQLARYGKLAAANETAAQAAAKAEEDRRAKLAAQTVTGAGPRPAPPDQQQKTWEEIVNAGSTRFRVG